MSTIVVTGAGGRIGRAVSPLLERPDRELRLLEAPGAGGDVEGVIEGDILDRDFLARAFEGADTVVHFAGFPSEREWDELNDTNITGTRLVLEAARDAGVRRVLLASSIHAVGLATAAEARATDLLAPRPDTYYGVTKAAMELLGAVVSHRTGMSIVSVRICAFNTEPSPDFLPIWFSPGDMARLIEAVAQLDDGQHHIVWGVSANESAWFPLGPGKAIGFEPLDDAYAWARERGIEPGDIAPMGEPLGGQFTTWQLGVPRD
ncbi:NAD-dependent epimerase/dehydratase family protein [Diaminobutyricimonas aerilata]|uniref:NAD-dependent epimerase/dehydratase family protein n=1 Tax=Diaminobutyricimonas aerilata TaxID=1162967 RepID=A0A2M9CFW0_9MICO|nr:NAD-dependent epimerase/dehydratase family protein [Diaminobutyricimonas aerilata]PJJ70758.1 NAD-dependent epimerase/dehydratase family protein [Diaminobutyricimonas aerilata]